MQSNLDLTELSEKFTKFLIFLQIIEEIHRISDFFTNKNLLIPEIIQEITKSDDPIYINLNKSVNWKEFFIETSNFLKEDSNYKEKITLLLSDFFFKIKK